MTKMMVKRPIFLLCLEVKKMTKVIMLKILLKMKKSQRGCSRGPRKLATKIRWGFRYTHFFYTVDPRPPYDILAFSTEWCIAAAQDPSDCETIQFAAGATLRNASGGSQELVVSYGVNDCEAKLATFSLDRVWSMLRPRSTAAGACVAPSEYD